MNQREIKFRAWDKERGKMREPDAIARIHMNPAPFGLTLMYKDGDGICMKFVLQQFTGLYDYNGKEIYEGDLILNQSSRICQVRWFQFAGCRDAEVVLPLGNSFGFSTANWERHVEVIGNIFENPELLDERKEKD
jgi:hypothetical protein